MIHHGIVDDRRLIAGLRDRNGQGTGGDLDGLPCGVGRMNGRKQDDHAQRSRDAVA